MVTSSKTSDTLIRRIRSNPECMKKVKTKQMEILENTGKVISTEQLIYVLYGDMDGLSSEDLAVHMTAEEQTSKTVNKTKQDTDKVPYFRLKSIVVLLGVAIFIGLLVLSGVNSLNQYSSEDNDIRKLQMLQLSNAITEFMTNNSGKVPYDSKTLVKNYLNSDFSDPDGTPYTLQFITLGSDGTKSLPVASYAVYVLYNAVCDTDNKAKYSDNKRNYAIMHHAYDSSVICVDNQ